MKSQGQWNAYVVRGKDKATRNARLAEVPEDMREGARRHVETFLAIIKFLKRKREGAK